MMDQYHRALFWIVFGFDSSVVCQLCVCQLSVLVGLDLKSVEGLNLWLWEIWRKPVMTGSAWKWSRRLTAKIAFENFFSLCGMKRSWLQMFWRVYALGFIFIVFALVPFLTVFKKKKSTGLNNKAVMPFSAPEAPRWNRVSSGLRCNRLNGLAWWGFLFSSWKLEMHFLVFIILHSLSLELQ